MGDVHLNQGFKALQLLQHLGELQANGVQQRLAFLSGGSGGIAGGPMWVVVLHVPTQFRAVPVAQDGKVLGALR